MSGSLGYHGSHSIRPHAVYNPERTALFTPDTNTPLNEALPFATVMHRWSGAWWHHCATLRNSKILWNCNYQYLYTIWTCISTYWADRASSCEAASLAQAQHDLVGPWPLVPIGSIHLLFTCRRLLLQYNGYSQTWKQLFLFPFFPLVDFYVLSSSLQLHLTHISPVLPCAPQGSPQCHGFVGSVLHPPL